MARYFISTGTTTTALLTANSISLCADEHQIDLLSRNQEIDMIELDPLLQAHAMDDVLHDIGLPRFLSTHPERTGRGVRLAVLDSGIDTRHPFLKVTKSITTCGESTDIPGAHGTHCAGSIASLDHFFCGVAPRVDLYNIKVLYSDGRSNETFITKGIDEALDLEVHILSMSVGFNHLPKSSPDGHGWFCANGHCPLCTAVDNASTLDNTLVVVAAGNEHERAENLRKNNLSNSFDTELSCPGNARETFTVGAITKNSHLPAGFSSRGPTSYGTPGLDLVAPGVNITSTVPVPRNGAGQPITNPPRNRQRLPFPACRLSFSNAKNGGFFDVFQ